MMHWEQLLSLKKMGDSTKRLRIEEDETRLAFEVDYDRIIFSSAFRSLQDKTQVIPLSKTDFVHTRLTHSLEVSVVGRSLGRQVGKAILRLHPHLKDTLGYSINDFGAIVAAASLAHDIGNPPFGHSGEKAIGDYFLNGNGKRFKELLTAKQYQDLVDFEGNANGFKILTQSREGVEGGLRLTYATLGAFMKYPKESLPKKPSSEISDKKFGVFQNDKDFFREVAGELGLLKKGLKEDTHFQRHPLAFLVEAADDICYTIIDFEDGINLGWIDESYALEYLTKLVKDTLDIKKYHLLQTTSDRMNYLRSLAISRLIQEAVNVFVENEQQLLSGTFSVSLLDKSTFKAQIDDIIKLSIQKIYKSREVIDKEIAGYKILTTLLDAYSKAIENKYQGKELHYDNLLLEDLKTLDFNQEKSLYTYLIDCCSYIAGLTDGNALLTFNKLSGKNV
ncbi:dGTPase [Planktosalinus lacus]|uniref:dGTPase n=2 Tax=Planktosalinus lacus TaxID=1526573 RepID=A0A8J2V840_9FLAO|nr:dGTPase [Planktosalinus lacus]